MARFVVVGNPGCRRVNLFQEALSRLGHPPASVVFWSDLLAGRTILSQHLRSGDVVRFESVGRNFQVEQQLLAHGLDEARHEGFRFEAPSSSEDKGSMVASRQWFLGLRSLFHSLQSELSGRSDLRFMHDLGECLVMSDKVACHARLQEVGVPVPPSLGEAANFSEMEAKMEQKGWSRVFGKIVHGSSASGVVALQTHQGRWRAQTTVEMIECQGETRLYNSRRPQVYESKRDIARLIDALARDRFYVERWLPKATRQGSNFDCRFVVVRGQIRQSVMRLSKGPLTNLHLGNERASVESLRERVGHASWRSVEDSLQRTIEAFPASLFAGADVAFSPSLQHHAVLELNAWGDLLPGVLYQGRDTYEEQIQTIMGRGSA